MEPRADTNGDGNACNEGGSRAFGYSHLFRIANVISWRISARTDPAILSSSFILQPPPLYPSYCNDLSTQPPCLYCTTSSRSDYRPFSLSRIRIRTPSFLSLLPLLLNRKFFPRNYDSDLRAPMLHESELIWITRKRTKNYLPLPVRFVICAKAQCRIA